MLFFFTHPDLGRGIVLLIKMLYRPLCAYVVQKNLLLYLNSRSSIELNSDADS